MNAIKEDDNALIIPPQWEKINLKILHGVVLVIGATDVGKSTLSRYLATRLREKNFNVAYLDGDPGQSVFGPPSTMTISIDIANSDKLVPDNIYWRKFIGSVTPKGHMLPTLVGAHQLVRVGLRANADVIIYDTTGLVDEHQGGQALKFAKIDLLQPKVIICIKRSNELEIILKPLRYSDWMHIIELEAGEFVKHRDPKTRQKYRRNKFKEYFSDADEMYICWTNFVVIPAPHFSNNQLISLENSAGYVLGLGIVIQHNFQRNYIQVLTTIKSLTRVKIIRLGDLKVDPQTFEDQLIR